MPPRLWGESLRSAWLDAPLGVYWGLAAYPEMPAKFHFWLNDQGGQHPDARWKVDVKVKPGQTYRPPTPMKVLSVVGHGKRSDWAKKTEAALKEIAL